MPCRFARMLFPAALLLLVVPPTGRGAAAEAPSPAGLEFFEKEIRPLLIERCLNCHGEEKPKGGLKLVSRAALLEGGDHGPAVKPGQPELSLLIKAVRQEGKLKMPPKEKLHDQEVATLTRWVQMGVPWPEESPALRPAGKPFRITDEQRNFWAFQPVRPVKPPAVHNAAWCQTDLDRFVLAGLESRGLSPAAPADKRTLLRRVTFDLTGLPPTPEEVEAFLHDDSADAFVKVVDRLLSSPHYGEHWGRHWLDLVRYADSFDARGIGGDGDIANAWRYRDWVVQAFNRDLPYDRFVLEQLAGDILAQRETGGADPSPLVATGMLAIGNWGGGDADKEKLLTDIVDDQIDVVGRTFLGLTLACARCHDHKFDPISQADYYGLAGIFFSTHILPNVGPKTNGPPMLHIPLASASELTRREQVAARMVQLEKQLKEATELHSRQFATQQRQETARYLLATHDYLHRPADQAAVTPQAFAELHGLHGYALRQWLGYLGQGDYRLMPTPVRDVLGNRGIHAWRGEPDCPSLTVNTTDKEVAILTFRLPPHSVSVHPGPRNGVVLAWKSPIVGRVRITGRVVDADPAGGDGIAWAIDQRTPGGRHELASGDFPNGGAQAFAEGKGAEHLAGVETHAGDVLELAVLPKANHTCDTTVVELTITGPEEGQVWDVTRDLGDDPLQANPHADRQGHAGVWQFLDMADTYRTARAEGATLTALENWHRTVASAADGKRTRADLEQAAAGFQKAFDLADARSPFWINDPADAKNLPDADRKELTDLAQELDALKKQPLPPLRYIEGALEGGVPDSPHAGLHDVRIHQRGRYDRLGDLVPRRFPVILAGEQQAPLTQGSGRLELAQWLVRSDNPLTARVLVNRLWQYHFGEGLVRSSSNFGKLGELPSHPELLDYLARQFVDSGWSIKKMHRLILLSAAYQQSSRPQPETLKADPENRLLGRMNRRRLEAESVRDNLLAVAGRLDRAEGGPATRDFNSPRRALYQMNVRSDRSGFGPLFDAADSTALVAQRSESTVAPQALFLLNHPFVVAQARTLAARLQQEGPPAAAGRIDRLYLLLFGRLPSERERAIGVHAVAQAGETGTAWAEYCHVLLCTNEFIYVD